MLDPTYFFDIGDERDEIFFGDNDVGGGLDCDAG